MLMLSRDSEDKMWSRFVIWPQEVTLAGWTQPSGPLCLWQSLTLYILRLEVLSMISRPSWSSELLILQILVCVWMYKNTNAKVLKIDPQFILCLPSVTPNSPLDCFWPNAFVHKGEPLEKFTVLARWLLYSFGSNWNTILIDHLV